MTAVEEQILRNQTAIMQALNRLLPNVDESLTTLENLLMVARETRALLRAECRAGQTVNQYPAP